MRQLLIAKNNLFITQNKGGVENVSEWSNIRI